MPVGVAIGVGGAASAYSSRKNAKDAAKASGEAADVQAASQQEALDYLKQINALPQELREKALKQLSDFYRIPGQQSQDSIKAWFQANPNASDGEIALAMQDFGVSPQQVAIATGKPLAEVEQRFRAQGGTGFYEPRGQDQLIAEAKNSPLYAAIMGTREGAVDEMARYASATGGLRSGNAKAAFAREGQRVSNDALLQSFNQAQGQDRYNVARSDLDRGLHLAGVSGLAGLDTGATEIAGMTADIGTTNAAGILGGAQAKQQGSQNTLNTLLGIAGLGIQAYGNGMIKI
jgi:hypothetical protein